MLFNRDTGRCDRVVEFPGYRWGNLGIFRRDAALHPWSVLHQPSGLALCAADKLRTAKRVVASLADQFDLAVLDRAAARETTTADDAALRRIKKLVKSTPGVS
jgi:hypothetical protein